ncbi:unnamed protein product [Rhizoctonia solani]|uniref:Uncharacterized protein n=1 Tax=Rhizoctonia solani TaxID=456999 RepID=A0A8H3DPQ4_9AGAM|nr:unnamed protein product [Rhizoctonia solani]
MPAMLPTEKAAQIKKLREEQAKIERMINAIGSDSANPDAVDSSSDPTVSNHTLPILGLQDFKKPASLRGTSLQTLCGLNDTRWHILKNELREVATKEHMVKLRPELKNLSDPDWFIRQTLRSMLKSSSESYRKFLRNENLVEVEDKVPAVEETGTRKSKGQGASSPPVTANGSLNPKAEDDRGKGKIPLTTTHNPTQSLPLSQQSKTRPPAEELHTEITWSSPVKSPFAMDQDSPDSDSEVKPRQPSKGLKARQEVPVNQDGGLPPVPVGELPALGPKAMRRPKVKPAPLVIYEDTDSDDTEFFKAPSKPPMSVVLTRQAQNVSVTDTQPTNNSNPESQDQPEVAAATTTTGVVVTDPTPVVGGKRKAIARNDTTSESPAPKKVKPTPAFPKTPARVTLIKNFETPVPASPQSGFSRITRANKNGLPSTSNVPVSTSAAEPANTSKSDKRKLAAQKAAATRAANKKAREEAAKAKAQSDPKERAKRKNKAD